MRQPLATSRTCTHRISCEPSGSGRGWTQTSLQIGTFTPDRGHPGGTVRARLTRPGVFCAAAEAGCSLRSFVARDRRRNIGGAGRLRAALAVSGDSRCVWDDRRSDVPYPTATVRDFDLERDSDEPRVRPEALPPDELQRQARAALLSVREQLRATAAVTVATDTLRATVTATPVRDALRATQEQIRENMRRHWTPKLAPRGVRHRQPRRADRSSRPRRRAGASAARRCRSSGRSSSRDADLAPARVAENREPGRPDDRRPGQPCSKAPGAVECGLGLTRPTWFESVALMGRPMWWSTVVQLPGQSMQEVNARSEGGARTALTNTPKCDLLESETALGSGGKHE
jgi:hypothetical protein